MNYSVYNVVWSQAFKLNQLSNSKLGTRAEISTLFIDVCNDVATMSCGGVPSQLETTASIWIKAFIGILETPTTVLAGKSALKNVV